MVKRVGCLNKIDKYSRQRSVFTKRHLKTTLPYFNSHEKYNENIDVLSKKPITIETYSWPSTYEYYAFCLFWGYFLHLVVDNNRISSLFPFSTLGCLFMIFWRCLWYGMIPFEINIENSPRWPRIRQWRQIYEVKSSPQKTGSIGADVQYVYIHSDQTIYLAIYK